MAYNISMGWKDSEVNLGMYGDGGRVGYTDRPVGRPSVVKALGLGSDIECIVRRWCLQFVGVRADVLFQCHLTTALRRKYIRTQQKGQFGDGHRNMISQQGVDPMHGWRGRSLGHPIGVPRRKGCR